ncbi:hypothetical protein BCR44DRAFT_204917 [Catenaria anguillulae PL171]|uniref:Uncharacterized protein n=1 Tax=Catenaria anguillulae PL171 TaxID=765915 RepID=A0A1Y2HH94_9FUNG|nr:hypothetical protein BCR44DRAFT_204917 [Catenaria anguillulae PL171]
MDSSPSDAAIGGSQFFPAVEHLDENLAESQVGIGSTPATRRNEAPSSPHSIPGHQSRAIDAVSSNPQLLSMRHHPTRPPNDGHSPRSGSASPSQSMRAAPSISDSLGLEPVVDVHKSSSGLSAGPGSSLHARFAGHGLAAAGRSVSDAQIGSLIDNIDIGAVASLQPTNAPTSSVPTTPLSRRRASYGTTTSSKDSRLGMAVGHSLAASASGPSSQRGSMGGLMVPGASPAPSHYFTNTGSPSVGVSGSSIAHPGGYAGYRYPTAVPVVHDPHIGQPHYIPVHLGMSNAQHVPGGSYLALSPVMHPQPMMNAHLPVNVRRAIRQVNQYQTLDTITGQSNPDIAPTVNIDVAVGSVSEIDLDPNEIVPVVDTSAAAKDTERESSASTNETSLPYFTIGRSGSLELPLISSLRGA